MNKDRKKIIKEFILQEISKEQILDVFDYIENPLLHNNKYEKVYEDICSVFSENSLELVDKQETKVLDYVDVANIMIKTLNRNQNYDFTKIIEQSSSVVLALFLMHRCYANIEHNFNQLFDNISSKIENDVETFLKCLYVQQNTMLFNICVYAWLFGKGHFEVYKQKENSLSIKKLNENEFKELKRKVYLLISYFNENIDLFKFLVLETFFANLADYINYKNKDINIIEPISIIFQIQIWGFKNIEKGAERSFNTEWVKLLSDLKKDKDFVKKLAVENILLDKNKDYTDTLGIYEYFRKKSSSHINPDLIAITKKDVNLLQTEYIENIGKFIEGIASAFEAKKNILNEILLEEIPENKPDKIYYNLYYICDSLEAEQKLKNNKEIFKELQKLNDESKIKNYCKAQFNIFFKAVDEIFDKY